ncbi:MAG: signal peptide peptidase SppA [Rickettsiales bacterium]|nr:signal peptide peptidase SppA [Rickettsiales bacterium]|tara:strand:- start:8770 stop:11232 length:2463 start_codon:yes stop_codon:yes gene_type:complete
MFSVKKIIILVIYITLAFTQAVSFAAISLTSVLKDTPTVRSIGMGNSFTGVAEAEGAIFFNPAGLAIPGSSYTIQYLDYDKLQHKTYYGNFVYIAPFGVSNIQIQDYNGNNAVVTAIGYGKQGSNGISWGLNYKSIEGNIDNQALKGWSSDFGLLANLTKSISLGLNVKDFYQKNIDLPTNISTGLSILMFDEQLRFATDFYLENNEKNSIFSRAGIELNVTDGLILRSGINQTTLYTGAYVDFPLGKFDFGLIKDFETDVDTQVSLAYQIGIGAFPTEYRRRKSLVKPSSYASFTIGPNLITGQSNSSILGGNKLGSNDLLTLINFANKDKTCKGFILRIKNLQTSLSSIGMLQEIRDELKKGKKKGKKIFAYIESDAGLSEYYLATVADVILLPQLGSIQNIGIHYEITQANKLLENFGLKSNIISSGRFKASNRLFSEESDELDIAKVEELVDSLFSTVISEIMKSRDLDEEVVDYISKGGIINADEALMFGLVDHLTYWTDVNDILKQYDDKLVQAPLDYFIPYVPSQIINFNKIAIIEVDGSIGLGASSNDFLLGNKFTGADEFDDIVNYLQKSPTIKGVILRVNSPGGGVLASDRIYHSIQKLKNAGKVVYTSMGNIAASGGYYVSVNSDRIFANSSSITGSIGVISSFISSEKLSEELGIDRKSIKTGEYMDLYSSTKQLDSKKRELLQQNSDFYYEKFVEKVKYNRLMTEEEVYDIAQGQVFTGTQALDFKIIDQLGGLYDVVDSLSDKLEIDKPQVIYFRKKGSLFTQASIESRFKTSFFSNVSKSVFSNVNGWVNLFLPTSTYKYESLIR